MYNLKSLLNLEANLSDKIDKLEVDVNNITIWKETVDNKLNLVDTRYQQIYGVVSKINEKQPSPDTLDQINNFGVVNEIEVGFYDKFNELIQGTNTRN